ncbi:MAG: sigma-54-dependent Fis family transcriptional regulator [Burkholderiales bacterium]|nr:sigma-54-dependent Fis family transcriptional regulator [Burkholderiales bacterium]
MEKFQVQHPELMQLIAESFFDYHTLPLDVSRLAISIGHAHGIAEMRAASLERQMAGSNSEFEMVGASPQMHSVFRAVRRVATADAPVLIVGESGTGKELAALAIHERSRRASAPFVPVNCAALPQHLIQSELFGHEKGSFTGAHSRRIGHIEAAAGGTLFLDEIGDLPIDLQVHLLRFLQERVIQRLGGNQPLPVDVRVIAATNVDLETAVQEGRFREDLYYRLNVLRLEIPPLRAREGDVELLTRFFFDKFARLEHSRVKGFSRHAIEAMNTHDWPGNVRELINRVRRAIVMCEGDLIGPGDLGLERRRGTRDAMTLEQARVQSEREAIRQALRRHIGNVTQAARELNISRMTMYRLMEKHQVQIPPQPLHKKARINDNVISLPSVSSARRSHA